MEPAQQPMTQTAISGFNALLGNMSSLGRQAQAIASEFAKMSEENLGAGAKAAERLRDAKSLQEVTNIQTDLIKESFECTTSHYRKIAEIAASTPQEVARGCGELLSVVSGAGLDAVNRASNMTRQMGDQAADVVQRSAETARRATEGVQRASRG